MRWLLPPGIEDLLPPQAQALEGARRRLLDLFAAWGYRLVMPPLVEYADALLTGTGADLAQQTFQVTDPLSGRLLAIRADITPQVARIDARDSDPAPARLCYLGSVLTAQEAAPGACRNPMQVGAELYGHGGPESDVEVLRLMLATLRSAGHDSTHVDLGHVGIFGGLSRAAGLDTDAEHTLFELLQRKARADIADFVAGLGLAPAMRDWFVHLPQCFGPIDRLPALRAMLPGVPEPVACRAGRARNHQPRAAAFRAAAAAVRGPGRAARLPLPHRHRVRRLRRRLRPGHGLGWPLRWRRRGLRPRPPGHRLQRRPETTAGRAGTAGSAGAGALVQ